MNNVTLVATAKFGLEGVVKQELRALGFTVGSVANGQIEFEATIADIPRVNLWLRSADRVLLQLGQFEATTFDALFEQTKALPWEKWIPQDGRFPVTGKSHRSKLRSVRSSQGIVKKAVVDRLQENYGVKWFDETGPEFPIQVAIYQNVATLTIDTSGVGLHKRRYREEAGAAPLKETFAAGLVQLSGWQPGEILVDPLCGSGTILIEAALLARNVAPGLNRTFAAESWPAVPAPLWQEARQAARAAQKTELEHRLWGSDTDAAAIAVAKQNAALASVADAVEFEQKALGDLWIDRQYGTVIANPPYGERMSEFKQINKLYRTLNKIFRKKTGWSVNILTADTHFPNYFKRSRPDNVRKFYNGPIRVYYYQYHGEKPGK